MRWGFIVLLALPLLIFFFRVFFLGQNFFENDITHIHYPQYLYTIQNIRKGEIPFWNGLSRYGVPHIADPQVQFFFPVWIGGLFFPPDRYFQWMIFASLLFGGLGCFFWVRTLTGSLSAALFCGMVFELQGFVLTKIFYTAMLWTIAFIPWVFWSGHNYLTHPSTKNRVLFLSLWILQFFSGHTQIWAISSLFLLLYLFFLCGLQGLKRIFWDSVFFIGFTAIQWVPTRELVQSSLRWDVPGAFLTVPSAVAGWHTIWFFFVPYPGGARTPSEDATYIGWMTFSLVCAGLFLRKNSLSRLEKFLISLLLLDIVFSLGPGFSLNFWQKVVYPFSHFLHPARFLVMSSFFLITLAGISLHRLKWDRDMPLMIAFSATAMTELLWWNWGYNFTTGREYFRGKPEFVRLLGEEAKNPLYRVEYLVPPLRYPPYFALDAGKLLPTPVSHTFVSIQYQIPFAGVIGHGPFLLRTQEILAKPQMWPGNFKDFLNIRWVIRDKKYSYKLPYPDVVLEKEGEYYEIYRNAGALPRIFLARRYEKVESKAKKRMKEKAERGEISWKEWKSLERKFPFSEFRARKWDPVESVLLEENPPEGWEKSDTLPLGEVKILSQKSLEIVVEVDVPAPRVLVVVENFYPGWEAWVDGKKVKIWMGNGFARTVPVPGGKHRVVMRYVPKIFFLGGMVTLLSLFLFSYHVVRETRGK
ncbi:MAG: YfhO family protein [bacterium JZ-2024 1]